MRDAPRIGIVLRQENIEAHGRRLPELTARIAAAGIDHVTVGDHVSSAAGQGADGLVQALCSLAPGRFTFGVGIGGDDPHELEICGVDPSTRGRRGNEAIELVRALLSGEEVSFSGRFFVVERAAIRPAPDPPPAIVVGGRSDAALVRAGRLGDAWIGVWVSPRRFAAAVERFAASAAAAGRAIDSPEHVLQLWAGFGSDPDSARRGIGPVLERAYGLPAERFERYVPCGRPDEIAAALGPYIEAGGASVQHRP